LPLFPAPRLSHPLRTGRTRHPRRVLPADQKTV